MELVKAHFMSNQDLIVQSCWNQGVQGPPNFGWGKFIMTVFGKKNYRIFEEISVKKLIKKGWI